jgi:hypothetical protein
VPERFDQLLQEKLDELDAAAEHEARLEVDEVEQLRLRAAHLVAATNGRPWATGAAVHYQQDVMTEPKAPSTLDISFPARPAPAGGAGGSQVVAVQAVAGTPVGRQGRREPVSGIPRQ